RLFFLQSRGRPPSTLFPYTTLFRSKSACRWFDSAPGHHSFSRCWREAAGILAFFGQGSPAMPVQELTVRVKAEDMEEVGRKLRRSEEHTSELQSRENLVCRLLLEKK